MKCLKARGRSNWRSTIWRAVFVGSSPKKGHRLAHTGAI